MLTILEPSSNEKCPYIPEVRMGNTQLITTKIYNLINL